MAVGGRLEAIAKKRARRVHYRPSATSSKHAQAELRKRPWRGLFLLSSRLSAIKSCAMFSPVGLSLAPYVPLLPHPLKVDHPLCHLVRQRLGLQEIRVQIR